MSKQAIIELLNSNAAKYRKAHSRKAMNELLNQLMELTGYKSPKSIIRYDSRARKRKQVKKRGRLPKLQPNDIELQIETPCLYCMHCGKYAVLRPQCIHPKGKASFFCKIPDTDTEFVYSLSERELA